MTARTGDPYTDWEGSDSPQANRSFNLMQDGAFQQTTLDNGLRVVTAPMPHTRSVAVSCYVGAGSRYETDEQAGLSHFVEHLCFKGTERRPTPREVSEVIDSVG
ncbi:MAG: insulinase family protein, partial [Dehalococcoidia bacterium]